MGLHDSLQLLIESLDTQIQLLKDKYVGIEPQRYWDGLRPELYSFYN